MHNEYSDHILWGCPIINKGVCGRISLEFVNTIKENLLPLLFMLLLLKDLSGGGSAPSSAAPQWDAMKLSLMIEEANAISKKLRKHTIFSR